MHLFNDENVAKSLVVAFAKNNLNFFPINLSKIIQQLTVKCQRAKLSKLNYVKKTV